MAPRGVVLPDVLMALAEREMEVERDLGPERRVIERGLHRRQIGVVEPHRLQIGKAPPALAHRRGKRDRPAVGGNRFVLVADGLEHVRQAHPQFGLAGMAIEHVAIDGDRLVIAPDPPKRGGAKVVVRVGKVAACHLIEQGEGFGGAVLAVEQGGEIGAGGIEAGRKLERSAEQGLGVGGTPDARGKFGHHPDRGHVEWIALEPVAKQGLGRGEIVGDQCSARLYQLRVMTRGGDRLRLGGKRGVGRPALAQCDSEQSQRRGVMRVGGEDRARLLLREPRLRAKQAAAVGKRLGGADRRCEPAFHP